MGALKQRYAGRMDFAKANAMVRSALVLRVAAGVRRRPVNPVNSGDNTHYLGFRFAARMGGSGIRVRPAQSALGRDVHGDTRLVP